MSEPGFDVGFDFGDPAVAAHYDELPLWSAPFGQLILERVPLGRDQVTLDIGAGTGFLSVELAQRCGPRSRVVAIDPWTAALDVLRSKLVHLELNNVELVARDASDTGLPDASADVAVSNLGVNNFDDPPAVLAECHRVLRPRGRLLISSNLVGHMAEFYETLHDTLVALGRFDRLGALDTEIAHRATVEHTVALLADCGFTIREVAEANFRWRFASGAALLTHRFVRLGFLAGWLDVIGTDGHDDVFAELVRRLDARAVRDGDLTLTIPMACFDAERR